MTICSSVFNLPPLEALAMNYITQVAIAKNDYEKAALLALYCILLPSCDSHPMISTVSGFFWPHEPHAGCFRPYRQLKSKPRFSMRLAIRARPMGTHMVWKRHLCEEFHFGNFQA